MQVTASSGVGNADADEGQLWNGGRPAAIDMHGISMLPRPFLTIALLLACLGSAAAQGGPGARVRVDQRVAPWSSIGKLQAVAGSLRITCTGALVGPRLVLSAAHCLYNPRTQKFFLPASLHFVMALQGQDFTAAALADRLQVAPDFEPATPLRTAGSDWALITLPVAVPDARLVLSTAPLPPAEGTRIDVGGYAQDNPNVLTADLDCRVLGFARDALGRRLIRHDCATTHGVSGAPLLARTDSGWTVVGINVARSTSGALGLAAPLEAVPLPR